MLFNSIEYFLFIHAFVILYWIIRKFHNTQNVSLLLGSYLFYSLWDYRFLGLIILSSFVDYSIGISLKATENKLKRKLLLCTSLSVNLGILFFFKYFNFFTESFAQLLEGIGMSANMSSLQIILPVGISFYTFQTLSYTIDIYRRQIEPTKDVIGFFTFVAFFPQLVAGPIERASSLLPQILKPRTFVKKDFSDGLRQILWGLFKKVAIADTCAQFVDFIFERSDIYGSWVLWLGAILFAFQIYCDFSGYSDIAIGSAKLLGIKLMQNFSTPYFSRNIGEFWRRWHISLSTWFRDYLYIPLGGSRGSKQRQLFNVFTTFVVSGLWHGANWTFVFWGFLHACFYIPSIFLNTNRKYLSINQRNNFNLKEPLKILSTFLMVCIAWVFFRAENISHAFAYLYRMFYFRLGDNNIFLKTITAPKYKYSEIPLNIERLYFAIFVITVMLIVEWINRNCKHGLENLPKLAFIRFFIYLVLSYTIVDLMIGNSPFIYFQF